MGGAKPQGRDIAFVDEIDAKMLSEMGGRKCRGERCPVTVQTKGKGGREGEGGTDDR